MRPWIAIEDVGYEFADNDCFRVNAKVKNVSGGPALNLTFYTIIEGKSDVRSSGLPSILPGQLLEMRSSNISGVEQSYLIEKNIPIEFKVEFEDAYGYPYKLTQKITPSGKLFDYTPEIKRSIRTLGLKI